MHRGLFPTLSFHSFYFIIFLGYHHFIRTSSIEVSGHVQTCPDRRKEMTKPAKLTKWPRPERIRQRMHLTLEQETHDFLSNDVQNASRFIDELIKSIRMQSNELMTTKIETKPKLSLGRESNPRPLPYQGSAIPLCHRGDCCARQ